MPTGQLVDEHRRNLRRIGERLVVHERQLRDDGQRLRGIHVEFGVLRAEVLRHRPRGVGFVVRLLRNPIVNVCTFLVLSGLHQRDDR